MQIHRLFSILVGLLVLISCLPGGMGQFQEQYATPSSGYSTSAPISDRSPLQFSQFYTMTSEISPGNPISAPQQFQIDTNVPSTIYLGEQMQAMTYAQYQVASTYTSTNSLWIAGKTAWTQYALIPLGATVSLYALTPIGGTGLLTYVDSDGQTYSHNYVFYPNSVFTFHADAVGRYTLSFALNGQASNQVVIDVVNTYSQPSYQGNYPTYYPWYYSENYYPAYVQSKPHIDGDTKPGGDTKPPGNTKPDGDTKPSGDTKPGGDTKPPGNTKPDGDTKPSGYTNPGGDTKPPGDTKPDGDTKPPGDTKPDGDTKPSGDTKPGGDIKPPEDTKPDGDNAPAGDNMPECGTGYHLENGKCVADTENKTV